jgi:signal peptidase II
MSANTEKQPWLWGSYSALGAVIALVTFAADQAHKWWMLGPNDLAVKGQVEVNRYLDWKFKLNTGISYSLLDQQSLTWQLALAAFALAAAIALWVWLVRAATSNVMAASLALIIGGALGNGLDRILHGGVVDYISVHFPVFGEEFYWYIFNIADCAIVAGVIGLLYDSIVASRNDAAKPE